MELLSLLSNYNIGASSHAITVGDFNNDGKQDIVTDDSYSNTVSVLMGTGDGTFQLATSYSIGKHPITAATADFNGDGTPDIATINAGSGTVPVLLHLPISSTTTTTTSPTTITKPTTTTIATTTAPTTVPPTMSTTTTSTLSSTDCFYNSNKYKHYNKQYRTLHNTHRYNGWSRFRRRRSVLFKYSNGRRHCWRHRICNSDSRFKYNL
ncbi:MAG: VCBS repeat-containing protein [Candidatus Midichloria sp.]|nr:VCBS repeat-containing protein [Candidatus Midichloria sp.]